MVDHTNIGGCGSETRRRSLAYLGEYKDWRLFLASRKLDAEPAGYKLMFKALDRAGISIEEQDSLYKLEMNNPFIRELRKRYRKEKFERRRLQFQTIGGRQLEDSYIYRIN